MLLQSICFVFLSARISCRPDEKGKQRAAEEPNLDFAKFDYCTLNCPERHSACKAKPTEPRVEILVPPQQEFRKSMVDLHNYYRNYLAEGNEQRPTPGWAGTASDMMAMNYDLELEYICRCRAVHSYQRTPEMSDGHDKCRVRIGKKPVGQNLYGSSANDDEHQKRSVKVWYDEVSLVKEEEHLKKKTPSKVAGPIGHFTQMIWSTVDMLGCWRVHNPINTPAWQYAVICDYGSTISKHAGNRIGEPLYKREKCCTECPNGTKCETKKYPGLCGPLKDLPTVEAPQCGGTLTDENETEPTSTDKISGDRENRRYFIAIFIYTLFFLLDV